MRKVITVDGPSGVGKGTLCQTLARDRSRSVAPLKPASDAVVIDTGTLSIADVQQQVNAEIAARFSFS